VIATAAAANGQVRCDENDPPRDPSTRGAAGVLEAFRTDAWRMAGHDPDAWGLPPAFIWPGVSGEVGWGLRSVARLAARLQKRGACRGQHARVL